jgi:hypothetical protein
MATEPVLPPQVYIAGHRTMKLETWPLANSLHCFLVIVMAVDHGVTTSVVVKMVIVIARVD